MDLLKPTNSPSFPWTIVMLVLALLSLSLPLIGFAAPRHHGRDTGISGTQLQNLFPPNATLGLPTSNANFLALGCGVQNYTCTSAGTYSWVMVACGLSTITKMLGRSTGALANLYDISTLFGSEEFTSAPNCGLEIWSADQGETNPFNSQLDTLINSNFGIPKLGIHQFDNFNGTADPAFDFTESQNNANDFMIAVKTAQVSPPSDPSANVAWLALSNVSGSLSSGGYRVFTAGGEQPSSVNLSRLVIITRNWFQSFSVNLDQAIFLSSIVQTIVSVSSLILDCDYSNITYPFQRVLSLNVEVLRIYTFTGVLYFS